jgi:hypothetical protein
LYGIFRYSKYNSFPIYIKSTKHTTYENTYGKYHNFLNNRTGGINPIFWETSISWEKTKYDLRNISTTPIIFQNVKLDAEVELYYGEHSSWESKLEAIHLKIPYKPDLESDLINYYGKKYIHMYYPKTGYYHNTWLFDKHYVSIERRCNNRENDYLYIRINRLNYIYYDYGKQKYLGLGDGAYFESKVKQQNGVYADSIANLSFHNIALGKHKNEVLSHIKNSPNVLNIIKYKSSEYGARVQEVMPENNIRIEFNTKLVFYRDTLCYLQITSNDKNAELYTTLLIEKYKSKNADK